jgi:hypothetical protein
MLFCKCTKRPKGVLPVKNRVKKLVHISASSLKPHPKNPRKHGETQRQAMSDALRELGFADAILAYESGGELVVLDGHMRREEAGDAIVPVLILDLDEEEAEYFLATHDPLTALATIDNEALNALAVKTGSLQIRDMLDALSKRLGIEEKEEAEPDARSEIEIAEMELHPFENYDYVMLLFNNNQDFSNACERLGIGKVAVRYSPKCRKVGLGRVIDGSEALKKLCK